MPEIYNIIHTFQGVYNFSNLSDFYKDDTEKLEELKDKINAIEWEGITRERVKNTFCTVLSDIIDRITKRYR